MKTYLSTRIPAATLVVAVIICHLALNVAVAQNKAVIETRSSAATSLTLQQDDVTGAELLYTFHTELEEYDDGTSASFLVGKVELLRLPTQYLYEAH